MKRILALLFLFPVLTQAAQQTANPTSSAKTDEQILLEVDEVCKKGDELEKKLHDAIYEAHKVPNAHIILMPLIDEATALRLPKELLKLIAQYLPLYKSPLPSPQEVIHELITAGMGDEINVWCDQDNRAILPNRFFEEYDFSYPEGEVLGQIIGPWRDAGFSINGIIVESCTSCNSGPDMIPLAWMEPFYYHAQTCIKRPALASQKKPTDDHQSMYQNAINRLFDYALRMHISYPNFKGFYKSVENNAHRFTPVIAFKLAQIRGKSAASSAS